MEQLEAYELDKEELLAFAKKIAQIAKDNGMRIGSCAETIDLEECGIEHNRCIDKDHMRKEFPQCNAVGTLSFTSFSF